LDLRLDVSEADLLSDVEDNVACGDGSDLGGVGKEGNATLALADRCTGDAF